MCAGVNAAGCCSAGKTSTSGWSSRARPRSTSRSAVTAVAILVIDATANRRVERDRDAEPAMGEATGVLEDRGAVAPGDRHAPEGVGLDLLSRTTIGARASSIRRLSAVAADSMRR